MEESLPPSTARFTPLIYPAAGDAKKAMAFAVSSGLPNRFKGTVLFMVSVTTSIEILPELDFDSMSEDSRSVAVKPGRILFTVIPFLATSKESVFAHDATAPRIVLETPNPCMGCLTEVEIILIIRPYFLLFMPVRSAVESI